MLRASSRSAIPGGLGAKTRLYGQAAHASGAFGEAGDAQAATYILRGITVGAQTNVLFLDGFSRGLTLEPAQTMTLDILVTDNGPRILCGLAGTPRPTRQKYTRVGRTVPVSRELGSRI